MRFSLFGGALLASLVSASPILDPILTPCDSTAKVPADSSLFPIFQRYATFGAAAQNQVCANPPLGSTVQAYIKSPLTNISGIMFRSDSTKEYIIGYQGTQGQEQRLSNDVFALVPYVAPGVNPLNCVGCLVATGFLIDWLSIVNSTTAAINTALAANPSYTLVIVGHSLGGAVATLAWASLLGLNYSIPKIYTLGQPRVGNVPFANFIDKLSGATETNVGNFYRLTHTYDDIPQLPPQNLTFQHSRTEYWLLNNTAGTQDAANTYRCFGQEPCDCNDSTYYINQPMFLKGQFTQNSQHEVYANVNYSTPLVYCS